MTKPAEQEDLHEALRRLSAQLSRVLDPRIEVRLAVEWLPPANVDPAVLENALVPLVRQARDALVHGGELLVTGLRMAESDAVEARLEVVATFHNMRLRLTATVPVRWVSSPGSGAPAGQAVNRSNHPGGDRSAGAADGPASASSSSVPAVD